MPIPFVIPDDFAAWVAAGKAIRFGAILKDVGTGKILGHLKEAGNLGGLMSSLQLGPAGALAHIASQIGQHVQLARIQSTLEILQLISTVGAVASVAGLGVSIAGFAVISRKLDRIDAKLDGVSRDIRALREAVERLGGQWDALTSGRLKAASEHLIAAESADQPRLRDELLGQAASNFADLRNYYFQLMEGASPWQSGDVPIAAATALHARFVACSAGQLQAEFLRGDLGVARASWRTISTQIETLGRVEQTVAFRARHDAMKLGSFAGPSVDARRKQLIDEIRSAADTVAEDTARLSTMDVELDFVQRMGLEPSAYLAEIAALPAGVVLIPTHSDRRHTKGSTYAAK